MSRLCNAVLVEALCEAPMVRAFLAEYMCCVLGLECCLTADMSTFFSFYAPFMSSRREGRALGVFGLRVRGKESQGVTAFGVYTYDTHAF